MRPQIKLLTRQTRPGLASMLACLALGSYAQGPIQVQNPNGNSHITPRRARQTIPKPRLQISRPVVGYSTFTAKEARYQPIETRFLTIQVEYAWKNKPDPNALFS